MLAYSSIAHAGYLLIGVVAGTPRGVTAMLIYLFVYAFMQLGAFAVIVLLRRQDVVGDELKDFSGLHVRQPVRGVRDAAVHAVARRHSADGRLHGQVLAVQRGDRRRATSGWRSSACSTAPISLYYYIRVVVFMYLKKETIGSEPTTSPALALALAVAVVGDDRARRLSAAAVRGGRGVGADARRGGRHGGAALIRAVAELPPARASAARALVKFFTRYAILPRLRVGRDNGRV